MAFSVPIIPCYALHYGVNNLKCLRHKPFQQQPFPFTTLKSNSVSIISNPWSKPHQAIVTYFTSPGRGSFSEAEGPIFSGKAMHAKRSLALRKANGINPELALRLMALPTNEGNARALPQPFSFTVRHQTPNNSVSISAIRGFYPHQLYRSTKH